MGQASSKQGVDRQASALTGLHHKHKEQAQLDPLSSTQRHGICSTANRTPVQCAAATTSVPSSAPDTALTSGRGFTYTAYEANAWEATFFKSGVTILVDPWLVGELVFGNQRWAYHGEKSEPKVKNLDPEAIASRAAFILLSQGLDDHAHRPTLERLPKDKPIVASPAGAAVAKQLGFREVHSVDHGQAVTVGPLTIRATMGALVGPPWSKRENGFVITENVEGGMRLYYEPHCDYDDGSVSSIGLVDAIITPASTQLIGGFFPLVKGNEEIVKLVGTLKPQVVVPLINAGFHASGPLSKIVSERGSNFKLPEKLEQNSLGHVRVEFPAKSGESKQILLE